MLTLWTDKLILDQEKIEKVKKDLLSDEGRWLHYQQNYYSSYWEDNIQERPEIIFLDEYREQIYKFMKHVNLFDRCDFSFDHWSQVYPAGKGGHHCEHAHFSYDCLFSWVHFIEPTDRPCFYFSRHEGGKKFVENQEPGTFMVFPSWALHGAVENHSDTDRLIVAGNVCVSRICTDQDTHKYHRITHATSVIEHPNWIKPQKPDLPIDQEKVDEFFAKAMIH